MTSTAMTWADFYLICFAVGFCFSFFSFVLGGGRFGRLHLPHLHAHVAAHLPAAHGPVIHAPTAGGHAVGAAHGPSASTDSNASHPLHSGVSPFNFVTLTAFLAWFGGTGYLLTRFSTLWVGFGWCQHDYPERKHFASSWSVVERLPWDGSGTVGS